MYFKDEEHIFCEPLSSHIAQAKYYGHTEITLIDAIQIKSAGDHVFCGHAGEVVERFDCTKAQCSYYEANKSGRGTCINRGKMYMFGEKVTIKIN